jgi:hypothetical protein
MKTASILIALTVLTTLGCGGSAQQPATASESAPVATQEPTASSAPSAVAVGDKWDPNMTAEQKAEFMKQKVMPAMEPIFKAHEPSEPFNCQTCHGPEFKLPKDFLPHLTFKDGNLTAFSEDPETAKFMAEKVTPAMASALGLPGFDPATQKGFGCGGCHTVDM